MGLWLMIVGAVGAGVLARPELGDISAAETLQLPTSASAARLVVPSGGAPAMVMHPGAAELDAAMQASRLERTIFGQFHDYAVRSMGVASLDGVAVGSAWQLVGEGAPIRCVVTGFEHVAPIDPTVSELGAPCGGSLVQAALDCDGPAERLYVERVAVPDGVPVVTAATTRDIAIDDRDHPEMAPLVAADLFQARERALSEKGAVEVSFSSRTVELDGAELTILSGVLYAPGDAVALSAVVRDGAALTVLEGGSDMVLDIGRDGVLEVLGWNTPPEAAASGVIWTIQSADHLLMQETISWCDAGC